MFVVKKLIALLLITGFFVVTIAGCPTPTTSGGGARPTGAGGAGSSGGTGGSAK
jgi:hypothetical protein